MTTIEDKAYKLASGFFLSSNHDDWSGARIRKAILADEDGDDKQALADQKTIIVWDPIERHIESNCGVYGGGAGEELDDLIENLASAFVNFANENRNP
jgi:hypothetical protein